MNKALRTTKNIVHLVDSAKNEDNSKKEISSKLKGCSVEMPNAPYSKRQTAQKPII